jgi:hypothetical protein
VDPAEVRLDLVFVSEDGTFWVLVEVQLDEDEVKARKWPLSIAALWNQHGVSGDLIVITAARSVAEWAFTIGRMKGPLGTRLVAEPVIVQLTGDVAELLLDPANPELAFFAAWTVHDRYGAEAQAIVERATDLIETMPDETLQRTLIRYILGMLHEKLLHIIREASMNPQKIPVSPALQRLGEEFQAMYGAELEARGEAKALLRLLAARKLPVDETTRSRILTCTDTATLERWVDQAANASSIDEVFEG